MTQARVNQALGLLGPPSQMMTIPFYWVLTGQQFCKLFDLHCHLLLWYLGGEAAHCTDEQTEAQEC